MLTAGLLLLAGCGAEPETVAGPVYSEARPDDENLYRFAVHPLHNPKKLTQAYTPLIDYLSSQIPDAQFELEASRDYQAYEQKIRAREPALLLPNPWQALEAMKQGYRVIAMAGDLEDFRGIILVRRDSPIREPADLKDRAVSYPSPTALAAAIMPQWFLHSHGVDVMRDLDNRYVGSQESSIMNVYLGEVAAGATWPPPWRLFQQEHPREAAELRVIWETPPLLNNAVMVRDDVPEAVVSDLRQLLLALHESEAGRAILREMQIARFHPADDAVYAAVRRFVERFERDVRKVDSH